MTPEDQVNEEEWVAFTNGVDKWTHAFRSCVLAMTAQAVAAGESEEFAVALFGVGLDQIAGNAAFAKNAVAIHSLSQRYCDNREGAE